MAIEPEKAELVVLGATALHNFLRSKSSRHVYTPPGYTDQEDQQHHHVPGQWRNEQQAADVQAWQDLTPQQGNNYTACARDVRDALKAYFVSPQGMVPWQRRIVGLQ